MLSKFLLKYNYANLKCNGGMTKWHLEVLVQK
jgi:hypothetical protein